MDITPRQQSEDRRPPKRVSQACEGCRRKKSKCPGEKPTCSLCARLGQACVYAEDGSNSEHRSAAMERRMDSRFTELEKKLEMLIKNQPQVPTPLPHSVMGTHANNSPGSSYRVSSRQTTPPSEQSDPDLLRWNQIMCEMPNPNVVRDGYDVYLKHVHCQPLPLFHPALGKDFSLRDGMLTFAILALAGECDQTHRSPDSRHLKVSRYNHARSARELALMSLYNGRAGLSTIQTFVLLSYLEFNNDHVQLSNVYLGNAIALVLSSGLVDERIVVNNPVELEERRRCFWSIAILEDMLNPSNVTLGNHRFTKPSMKPTSPSTESKGTLVSPGRLTEIQPEGPVPGIVAATIPMFVIFRKAAKYVTDTKAGVQSHPPWLSQSDYAAIVGELMELESTFTPEYRFDRTKMSQYSKQTIEENWSFWCTWLINQFMYHTILILLNHPFINSRRIAAAQRCPRTFSQSTSDLVVLHSNWIIRILEMLEEKQIALSDPFLGYCISVSLTVFLHYRTAEIPGLRQNAEKGLAKGQHALENVEVRWQNVGRMASRFRELEKLDTAQRLPAHTKPDLLWDLLIFSSSNRAAFMGKTLFDTDRLALAPDSWSEKGPSRMRPASARNTMPSDGNQSSLGTVMQPVSSSSAPIFQPPFPQGVQFPVADPSLMTFDDQNLAAITEFLDQNSGRMFNEWWDFGDL